MIDIYVEIANKRSFASAINWPGWTRSGKNPEQAKYNLFDYRERYKKVLEDSGIQFLPPFDISELLVVEQLEGNASTNFGAPGKMPEFDRQPINAEELERSIKILKACWKQFDLTAKAAQGVELRKGPRGGGRDLEGISWHLIEADKAYLGMLTRPVSRGISRI